MTQDVFELLRIKEKESKEEKKFYVHYEPSTGEIIYFRNYIEQESYPFITVTEADIGTSVIDFDSTRFLVIAQNNKPCLVKKIDSISDQYNINDLVYQIPKIVLKNRNQIKKCSYDIVIEQNNKDGVFRLKLDKETKEFFLFQKELHQLSLDIYVTAENDPNILYQTLEFKMYDLVSNEYYTLNFDKFFGNTCNLYSKKYFQNYLHADIR